MKRNLIIILFTMVGLTTTNAQDLLVMKSGDSIQCNILDIEGTSLVYTLLNNGVAEKNVTNISQVENYALDYYGEESEGTLSQMNPKSGFRWAIQAGYTYRYKEEDELKSGFNIGTDFSIMLSESLGLGAKYTFAKSDINVDGAGIDYNTHFIGPNLISQSISPNGKGAWVSNIAVGYLGANLEIYDSSYNATMKGGTFGMDFGIGYDIQTSDNFAIGFGFSWCVGTLNKIELTEGSYSETVDLDEDSRINLGHLNFTVGIRFN